MEDLEARGLPTREGLGFECSTSQQQRCKLGVKADLGRMTDRELKAGCENIFLYGKESICSECF